MKAYQFTYLRYIHDVSTQEFVNIGIVMFIPKKKKFLYKLTNHYARLSEFYLNFDGDDYRYLLRDLKARLDSAKKLDLLHIVDDIGEILPKIVPIESGCFQWSDTMSGVIENPEQRIERLYDKVILAHEKKKIRQRISEKDIVKKFSNLLKQEGLLSDIKSNVMVSNKELKFSYEFKYGWQNGTKQFAEPISLDYKNKKDLENKVSGFIGDMFSLTDVEDFEVTGIVAPPTQNNLTREYENAIERLKEAPNIKEIVLENQLPKLISKIQQDISEHKLKFN